MYREGHGVVQDHKKAIRWYTLAAQQGHLSAQLYLGDAYRDGSGVEQNYGVAFHWYTLAARQRDDEAQYNLGLLYKDGKGVLQDFIRAHMWFNITAVSGDKDSLKNRDEVASKMTPLQIEQAQRMARECLNSRFKNCD